MFKVLKLANKKANIKTKIQKNLNNQEIESGAMLYCSRTGLKSHHRDNPLQARACTMLFHVNMLPADTS